MGKSLKECELYGFKDSAKYYEFGAYQDIWLVDPENYNGLKNVTVSSDYYTVTYKNNQKIGTATMIITGQKAYSGTIKKTFKVTGVSINKVSFSNIKQVYDGSEDSGSKHYYIGAYYKSIFVGDCDVYSPAIEKKLINAGSVKVKVSFYHTVCGEKTITIKTDPFEVNKKNCVVAYGNEPFSSRVLVVFNKSYSYSSGAVIAHPDVYFKAGDGHHILLKEGEDYTVTCKNNKKVGKATATLKFKGNFKGTIAANYDIVNE